MPSTVPADASDSYSFIPRADGTFNVSRGGCNPMPGATGGFASIAQAQLAVRVLEHTEGDAPGNGHRFWDLWHRVSGVTQRERLRDHKTAARLGMRVVRLGRHSTRWVPMGTAA